jgi:dienelactone hydrolase
MLIFAVTQDTGDWFPAIFRVNAALQFAHFRDVSAKLESEGWRVAAPDPGGTRSVAEDADASCVVREEPPKE